MNAAKAYRKLKEVEETKLSNRLMLLRLELAKSQKKIEETEKRTQSIVEHKAAIEARNRAKVEEMRRKQEEASMAAQINQIARTRMAIIRRSKVKGVAEQKREDAQAIISARKAHYDAIEQSKTEQLQRAMAVKNFVKSRLDGGKEARRRDALLKREAARAAFAERVRIEAEKSKAAEEKVSIMEAEELKLIKMLEQTQEYQRHAYHELENALVSSRTTISHAHEELRSAMAGSMSARATSRLAQRDADAIAVATLPPVMRKTLPKELKEAAGEEGGEEEKEAAPAAKKPAPPSTAKKTGGRGGKGGKLSASASTSSVKSDKQGKEKEEEKEAAEAPAADAAGGEESKPAESADGAAAAEAPAGDAAAAAAAAPADGAAVEEKKDDDAAAPATSAAAPADGAAPAAVDGDAAAAAPAADAAAPAADGTTGAAPVEPAASSDAPATEAKPEEAAAAETSSA